MVAVIGAVVGALGLLLAVVTAVGWFRAFVHRVPPAHGDAGLAAVLGEVAGRRTRRAAAAVVDHDGRVRSAYIGADATSRFEIGSISKALTGMLLSEAVTRGEVTLDSTVGALLPDTAGSPLASVTLRELCTHTSGLPGLPPTLGTALRVVGARTTGTNPYRGLDPASVVRAARRQPLGDRGAPRYSNLGAAVLGHALAAAAGRDFPTVLAERVCVPLGMSRTRIATRHDAAPRGWTAAGRRSQPWVMDGYAPAGGAVSTLADLTRMMTALLERTAPGLASLDPVGRYEPDHPDRASGMFWVIDRVPGTHRTTVWHNGETGGYSAFLALHPEAGRAVVVLADVARAEEQHRIATALTRWLVTSSPPTDPPDPVSRHPGPHR